MFRAFFYSKYRSLDSDDGQIYYDRRESAHWNIDKKDLFFIVNISVWYNKIMNELPKLVGGDIPPEIKSEYPGRMEELEEEKHLPVKNELEKTQNDLESIFLIREYLEELLIEFNIPQNINIVAERIHLLADEDYKKQCPDYRGGALTKSWNGIFVNADWMKGVSLFHAMLHEFVHELSHKKYRYSDATKKVEVYRSGYSVSGYDEKKERHYSLLEGFNEAMTSQISKYMLQKHSEEIREQFGISEEGLDNEIEVEYPEEREQLEDLVKRIAELRSEPLVEVWNKFVRGYFTGEMMHLRDIERVFGKGTLKNIEDKKSL